MIHRVNIKNLYEIAYGSFEPFHPLRYSSPCCPITSKQISSPPSTLVPDEHSIYHPRVFGIHVRGYGVEKPVLISDFHVVNPGRFAAQIAQRFRAHIRTIRVNIAVDRQHESQRSTPKHGRVIWVFVEILKIKKNFAQVYRF